MGRSRGRRRGCCRPNLEWSRAMGCLPLAAAGLFTVLSNLLLDSWEVARAITSPNWTDWLTATSLTLATMKVAWCLTGAFGILARFKLLMLVLVIGNRVLNVFSVISLVLVWTEFGRDFRQGWRPDDIDIVRLTLHTTAYVIVFVFCHWQTCVVSSLNMVIRAGGTGWEYENYKEFTLLTDIVDSSAATGSPRVGESGGYPKDGISVVTSPPSEPEASDSFEAVAITPMSHDIRLTPMGGRQAVGYKEHAEVVGGGSPRAFGSVEHREGVQMGSNLASNGVGGLGGGPLGT